MFEAYSTRARQLIFIARADAGDRGAPSIDVGDLLFALVREDQEGIVGALSTVPGFAGRNVGHTAGSKGEDDPSFFSPEQASQILQQIEAGLPRLDPIPTSTDMPMSTVLGQVLAEADEIPKRFHQKQVAPLHLLLAIAETSTEGAQVLSQAGITTQRITRAIEEVRDE